MSDSKGGDILLAIDCGTQSLRTLLFDLEGNLLEKVKIEYEPYQSGQPGWAEQDPEVFWKSLCRGCQRLAADYPALWNRLAGAGVTAQRDSMVCMDAQGNTLRPVITWLDQRKAKPVYRPRGLNALAYQLAGMDKALLKTQSEGKGTWIQQNQPEIWEKTDLYTQVSGFLNFRLTGERRDSVASQIGHIPFQYKKRRWAGPRELNSRLFPVEPEKLPEIVEPGEIIGRISRAGAEATGIPEGLPVVAAGSDKGCETLGMGVTDESLASLSFGTTATVQTTSDRYYEPLRFMPAYPAPLPNRWNPEVEIFRGFWMITWFRKEFCHKEVLGAQEQGVAPEVLMDRLLQAVPAGSMGLMVQPFWSPGLKQPAAKGAMIGFGDVHTRAYVYRGVIEGLGYALRDGLHAIEKKNGRQAERIAVSGGASRSDSICQISADILGRPLVRGRTAETSGLGAALVTAAGLGLHRSIEGAAGAMVHYADTFAPDPANRRLYDDLFGVYQKMYPGLQGLYRAIARVTGYPEPADVS